MISLTLAFVSSSAAQPSAKRVLILHSFATLFAPDATVARDFREELSRRSPLPVDFFEISLQPAPSAETALEEPVASYIRSTVAAKPMDLIVTLGAPAAMFAQRHRARMFPPPACSIRR